MPPALGRTTSTLGDRRLAASASALDPISFECAPRRVSQNADADRRQAQHNAGQRAASAAASDSFEYRETPSSTSQA